MIRIGNTNLPLLAMFLSFQTGQISFFGILELMLFLVDQTWCSLDRVVRRAAPRESVLVPLCTVHDLLADVTSHIDKVYSLSTLCITLSCFSFLNVNIFIGIKRGSIDELFLFVGWSIIICLPILRIVISCGGTTRKVSHICCR